MIPVYKPYLSGNVKNYVIDCIDTTWISSKGEYIQRFEQAFASHVGVSAATSVCNGTVAIHLALLALGIGPGDEVIVPTFTYIASVNSIFHVGAKPVYVDSLEETWQVDPEDIIRKITSKTKAIMVVHLYGLPCEMNAISAICERYGLKLIEDCAEAFGTKYNDISAGCFGDVSTFSFFGNKTITTGEGGMVLAKSKETLDRICHLKNQGVSKTREYWHDVIAYNYRMTNICAAIGLAQLECFDDIIAKKRAIASWYTEELLGLPLSIHREQPNTLHSFWMCSIAVDEKENRDPLRELLKERQIETRPVFTPAHCMPHSAQKGDFPVAESLSSRGINLPSYPELSQESVHMICEEIKRFFD